MCNCKSTLHETVANLARTCADAPLSDVQRILRGILVLDEIHFVDLAGRDYPPDLRLGLLIQQPFEIVIRVGAPRHAGPARDDSARPAESRFRETPLPPVGPLSSDQRYEFFLREFIRLEQHHEFMWAGYIVRELLPRLGFPPEEAKVVLDRLRAENLVTITKVPNPKNPDFPATGVQLNHEHPRVKALLESHAAADHELLDSTPGAVFSGTTSGDGLDSEQP